MWNDNACRLFLGVLGLFLAFMVYSLIFGKQVAIQADDKVYTMVQFRGTVADALSHANITLRRADRVQPSLLSRVADGQMVKVTRVSKKEFANDQLIEFTLEKRADRKLLPGQEKVVNHGSPGVVRNYYEATYWDSKEVERRILRKEVLKKPQPMMVAYGPAVAISRSKLRPVVPEAMDIQGNERVITAVSTAYTHTGHRTASGIKPYRGVVSVDPRVIPLGTKLFVENYGPAIALDTGGDIKGNRIDVFFDTREEALSWGRRSVKVRVLE